MATDQEKIQAAQELEVREWAVRPADGGWVVETKAGRRVWPMVASEVATDPWLAVLAAAPAWDARQDASRDRGVRQAVDAIFRRGLHPRPRRVTVTDPLTGEDRQEDRWDLFRRNGVAVDDARVQDHQDALALLRAAVAVAAELGL